MNKEHSSVGDTKAHIGSDSSTGSDSSERESSGDSCGNERSTQSEKRLETSTSDRIVAVLRKKATAKSAFTTSRRRLLVCLRTSHEHDVDTAVSNVEASYSEVKDVLSELCDLYDKQRDSKSKLKAQNEIEEIELEYEAAMAKSVAWEMSNLSQEKNPTHTQVDRMQTRQQFSEHSHASTGNLYHQAASASHADEVKRTGNVGNSTSDSSGLATASETVMQQSSQRGQFGMKVPDLQKLKLDGTGGEWQRQQHSHGATHLHSASQNAQVSTGMSLGGTTQGGWFPGTYPVQQTLDTQDSLGLSARPASVPGGVHGVDLRRFDSAWPGNMPDAAARVTSGHENPGIDRIHSRSVRQHLVPLGRDSDSACSISSLSSGSTSRRSTGRSSGLRTSRTNRSPTHVHTSSVNHSDADDESDDHSVASAASRASTPRRPHHRETRPRGSGTTQKFAPEPWSQLKRVQIPTFSGDKRKYETWRAAFNACVDAAPATPEYKLLQLKQYLAGEPLEMIEKLGYSQEAYSSALSRLERKYGGTRRKVAVHLEELEEFPSVKLGKAKELEKFVDVLEVAIVNLKDAGRQSELQPGTLYTRVLQKLPEQLITQYQRWLFDHGKQESMEAVLEWASREADFQMAASETVSGLRGAKKHESSSGHSSNRMENSGRQHGQRGDRGRERQTERTYVATSVKNSSQQSYPPCPVCQEHHGVWKCAKFKDSSIDQRWSHAKTLSLCYRCLGVGHQGQACRRTRECGVDGCKETHHYLLHRKRDRPSAVAPTSNSGTQNEIKSQAEKDTKDSAFCTTLVKDITEGDGATHVSHSSSRPTVSMRTVPVVLFNGKKSVVANALLDDGSTRSYVNEDVAAQLGVQGHTQKVSISVLNDQVETFTTTPVTLGLRSVDGTMSTEVELLTTRSVTGKMRVTDWSQNSSKWEHLKGIRFPTFEKQTVDLLIGLDHSDLHFSLHDIRGKPGEPVARLTPLGWTCVASSRENSPGEFAGCTFTTRLCNGDIETAGLLRKFWELDEESFTNSEQDALSIAEAEVLNTVKASMKQVDGRYEVSIPWKSGRPDMPDSYEMALRRLISTERRLLKQPDVAQRYSECIEKYVDKGYVRKIFGDDASKSKWVLPHFPVVRMDRATTKVRIVFDASARVNGTSLNDVIHQGPKLQQNLNHVLLRFRRFPIAIGCDISEMYLQIQLTQEDRPYHRFLWRNCEVEKDPVIYEFTRVMFGVNCSPFLAQLVTQAHARSMRDRFPLAAEAVLESTYMDDSLDSARSVEEAVQQYKELMQLWGDAGMCARKWVSNSKEVLAEIPPDDRVVQVDLATDISLPSLKTLGVLYLAEEDVFSFKLDPLPASFQCTKRNVLRKISTIYDPLGFLTPVTVSAKVLLQEMWAEGFEWDELIPRNLEDRVRQWFSELPGLADIRVDRCLMLPVNDDCAATLHVFADASTIAYGAVAYVRSQQATGEVKVRFVASKSRVAPVEAVTVPRLELLAAVVGLQLAEMVTKALNFLMTEVVFWSDSLNVLYWLRGRDRRFKTFVANRVGQIRRVTDPSQWKHVPTTENPADLISRGCTVEAINSEFWWNGPAFLAQSDDCWPSYDMTSIKSVDAVREEKRASNVKEGCPDVTFSASNVIVSEPSERFVRSSNSSNLNPDRCGSWQRYVRLWAWVKRFINNCQSEPEQRTTGELEHTELLDAELEICGRAQEDEFPAEIEMLKHDKPVPAKSTLSRLQPMMDEGGVLRCRGRLEFADYLPTDTVQPIILPRHHPVTRLIIQYYHEKANHVGGTNHVLADISSRFWIVGGREAVRDSERQCARCKLLRARPASQVMAPLPPSRITPSFRAFVRTGVDFAGPFETVQGRGKKRTKRYMCLFTCLVTRAVHLEMAFSLDTSSFLNAFYRFVGRRGLPELVLSDNGTNFVGAARELQELFDAMDKTKLQQSTAYQGVKWKFNPPAASHFGGVFEVMIRSAKRAVFAILSSADVTDEELQSAFVGAESLINSRPLTYMSSNPLDETPLTPNHFLFGQCGGVFAPPSVDELNFSPRQRWRRLQELVRHFWSRWIREWLPLLSSRSKWHRESANVQVGDVMLLLCPDTPRGNWPLARVTETFPGKDGKVRVVQIRVGNRSLRRPISKLCPIESAEKAV